MALARNLTNAALTVILAGAMALAATPAAAVNTIVEFNVNDGTPGGGTFQVELFDEAAPLTVANFLGYVDRGDYTNSLFHRLALNFVLQGGGFTANVDEADDLISTGVIEAIPAVAPVKNEYDVSRSNLYGTIAMAKLGSGPDTATNQFFFNLGDNSANLDNQNGGFTVFGRVVDDPEDLTDGMAVVETLAGKNQADLQVETWRATQLNSAFGDLPLVEYSFGDTLVRDHLEMIYSITRVTVDSSLYSEFNGTSTAIPEPTILALLGPAVAGLLGRKRR